MRGGAWGKITVSLALGGYASEGFGKEDYSGISKIRYS